MCGIAGIINLKPGSKVSKKYLAGINQRMVSRGPEKSGFWYSQCQQIGFAHNRLSFIDLHQRSDQPLEYLNGRYVITYNGEIYNYAELRQQLIKKEYRFNTQSDTEVIMAMYHCMGVKMLDELRGMFAFAIWDNQEQKLFAARDPFGVKPFYYSTVGEQFVFASQVKSISLETKETLTSNPSAWCGYLLYGSVPEPFTTYKQINALPAGHFLEIDKRGSMKQQAYYCVYDDYYTIEQSKPKSANLENIERSLTDSVNYHLVADVPVGLFLSAGIDSNIIACLASQLDRSDLVGFTMDFEEFDQQKNESALAGLAAKKFGLNHQLLNFSIDELTALLDAFFIAMDQPSIDGLNVWMISKVVSEAGYRAVLSGLGGDEVFAGYPSFNDVPKFSKWLKLVKAAKQTGLPVEQLPNLKSLSLFSHPKFAGFANPEENSFYQAYRLKRNIYLKQELREYYEGNNILSGIEELESQDEIIFTQLDRLSNPYLKVSALEMDNYMKNQLLKDADWASMSHSLELRVPFVDRHLVQDCASEIMAIKNPQKIQLMQQIFKHRIPTQILNKPKTGFETPVETWLKTSPELQNWTSQAHLADDTTPWARRWSYEVQSRFFN